MINPFKGDGTVELSTEITEPDSWGCFVEGYFWSSKLLLEEIIRSDTFHNKWVAYPILFCIRHYYELSLKDILVNLGYIYNETYLRNSHNLDDLLTKVEENATRYLGDNISRLGKRLLISEIEERMKSVRKEMHLFIHWDNNAVAFRFPYSKSGACAIPTPIRFQARRIYDSLLACRRQLTRLSTQLTCDDQNPMFNESS